MIFPFVFLCTKVTRTNSLTLMAERRDFSLRLIAFIWQVTETAATAETHISKCTTYASDGTAHANVGLSSTISADRNISPPRQINLDIKVMTGAVITWCNQNPELFSSHPAWWIHTNAVVMLFFSFFSFSQMRYIVYKRKAQIWSNEKHTGHLVWWSQLLVSF